MPKYDYACTQCQHSFETVQSFADEALTVCPECGGRLRKVFSSVGVVFKGSGFYRTDSRASSTVPAGDSGGGTGGSGTSTGSNGSGSSGSDASGSTAAGSKGSESKGSASKGSESKGSESKGSGSKGSKGSASSSGTSAA